jgi:transcriptional regulator of acetoin/glycerol metabolism
MSRWTPAQRVQAADLAALTWANPFAPERLVLEHRLLGLSPPPDGAVWHPHDGREGGVVPRLAALAETLAADGVQHDPAWEGVATYALYERVAERCAEAGWPWYAAWRAQAVAWLPEQDPDHLLACLFQVRRAFSAIFAHLIGASRPMGRLRADCWRSIFGADLQRYRRVLYQRLPDFPTLVTGPSGSGKELVAAAIAASGYRGVRGGRVEPAGEAWLPLAISALAPALVEGELFGHRKGAFTGASADRAGWLEVCPAHGCVFLDEIGEVEPAIQVKLLRVLQTRRFSRVGEHAERTFRGRLIAATNRDLAAEISAGRFRADVYYRLCGDQVRTPALRAMLDDDAGELDRLCLGLAQRILGGDEAPGFAAQAAAWIRDRLGEGYAWPGNVRELEQCLRNLLLRGSYAPALAPVADAWLEDVRLARLDAERLLDGYCARVVAQAGGFRPAARQLGLDWRTVAARARRCSA